MLRTIGQKYAATMYPELIADIEKAHWLVKTCINESDTHYARVYGEEGQPKAALLTRTQHNSWAIKKSASVMLWYSEVPGMGAQLLRGFREWCDENSSQIVIAGFIGDWVASSDAPFKIAERVGFKQRGGGFFYFPRRK